MSSLALPEYTPTTFAFEVVSNFSGLEVFRNVWGAGIRRGKYISMLRVATCAMGSREPSPRMARKPKEVSHLCQHLTESPSTHQQYQVGNVDCQSSAPILKRPSSQKLTIGSRCHRQRGVAYMSTDGLPSEHEMRSIRKLAELLTATATSLTAHYRCMKLVEERCPAGTSFGLTLHKSHSSTLLDAA